MAGYESQKDYEESVGSGPHKHKSDAKGYCKFCGKDMSKKTPPFMGSIKRSERFIAKLDKKKEKKEKERLSRPYSMATPQMAIKHREEMKEKTTTPRKLMHKMGIPVVDK